MGASSSFVEEVKIKNSDLVPLEPLFEISKSICKIDTSYQIASGFLIKFYKRDKDFFCLLTNEHVVTKDLIKKKEIITIYYNNEKIRKEICLNPEQRYINDFRYKYIDATVIEILPKDNIDKEYFLLPAIDYIYDYKELINKEIKIIQYPGGKLSYSKGKIKKINNNEFTHLASTEPGSSGSPIFLLDSNKVIGIHKGSEENKSLN